MTIAARKQPSASRRERRSKVLRRFRDALASILASGVDGELINRLSPSKRVNADALGRKLHQHGGKVKYRLSEHLLQRPQRLAVQSL